MKIINWSSPKFGPLQILVDDEDYENVKQYSWGVITCMNSDVKYVKARYVDPERPRKYYSLHRFVLGEDDPKIFIDHIDGNGLNNQKSNLRRASHRENTRNSGIQKNNNTGFKGVILRTESKGRPYKIPRYVCNLNVRIPGSTKRIFHKGGSFLNPYEAAVKYNELALKLYGEFANLNPVTATKYKDGTMYVHEKKTGIITERVHQFIPTI